MSADLQAMRIGTPRTQVCPVPPATSAQVRCWPGAALLVHRTGQICAVSAHALQLLAWSSAELEGQGTGLLGVELAALHERVVHARAATASAGHLLRLRCRDGRVLPCLISVHPYALPGEDALLYCAVECSAQLRLERRLRRLAFLDPLTHLPNRAAFLQRLPALLATAGPTAFALVVVDLDRFRMVNESHGYALGSQVLAMVAGRLRERLAAEDLLARLDGDAFALLLTQVRDRSQLVRQVEQILQSLLATHDLGDRRIALTASAGVVYPIIGEDPARLLEDADTALARAKDDGGRRIVLFEDGLRERARMRLQLFHDLQRALRGRELEIHLQPIVDARSARLVAMEALLRWPERFSGACGPAEFIPLSEGSGLAPELDRLVVEQAARWLAYLRNSVPAMRGLPVNVNISALSLRSATLIDLLRSAREQYALEPQALRVEITETALLSDSSEVRDVLQALARGGTPLVLDDFGTGYSSLRHLHDLPISGLKIDKLFVHRALHDPRSLALVKSTIALATALGVSTTAEGIETEDQRSTLARLGCHALQGFLFARPMPPEAMPAWIERSGFLP